MRPYDTDAQLLAKKNRGIMPEIKKIVISLK